MWTVAQGKPESARNPAGHADEWDAFLALHGEVGYKQSSWWARFLGTRGWEHFGAVVRDRDLIVGGARVLVKNFAPGRSFFYLPHGPVLPEDVGDAAEVFQVLLDDLAARRDSLANGVSHLRVEPRWTTRPTFISGCHEATSWLEPRQTICVDLRPGEDAVFGQMKSKGRYNIRVARRHGVRVVEDCSVTGIRDFMTLYRSTAERQGIRRHSSDYFRELADRTFPEQHGTILFAEHQGTRVAAVWLICFGDTVTYKYGGSLAIRRNVMAPYLLHFEAMRLAMRHGFRWYDFYGVSPADRPDDPWAGISAFKRRFGGCDTRFVPALDFVYDDQAYQQYLDVRRKRRQPTG